MKSLRDILSSGTAYLEARGTEAARSSMQALIAHVMGTDRTWIYLHMDEMLPEEKLVQLRDLLRKRGQGVPLQHLLGSVEFYRRNFRSDSRALIPRPETEELVELALRTFSRSVSSPRILDMGCGSGVIGITLALELRDLLPDVSLIDISPAALSLALENATSLGARVRTFRSDLFSAWQPLTNEEDSRILPPDSFHLVLANLPYVPDHETLQPEVAYDPATALYGGKDGLDVIRRFLAQVRPHMEPDACMLLEVGHDQGERVIELMRQAGFTRMALHSDMNGMARFPICYAPPAATA